MATAPIELTRVGKWLEHVPDLRLDGARPSSRALAARLASFWLPGQVVLYIGASSGVHRWADLAAMDGRRSAIAGRSSAGYWLKTLRDDLSLRVWWATTDALEEYEDALLGAFDGGLPAAERAGARARGAELVLPFATLRRPTGERRRTGISRSAAAPSRGRAGRRRPGSSSCPMATPRAPTASHRSASDGSSPSPPRRRSGAPRPARPRPAPPTSPRRP